jgi:DNA-binding MurR/RpiR family transcriptional regulator
MSGDMILEKIRQLYPKLTKSQKRLADFIATSYREAAFMTASRLARRVAVNEATVIRFAQRLGYGGYPELVDDIQAIVQEELKAKYEAEGGLGTREPFFTILDSEVENLQRGISHLVPELVSTALVMLRQASHIYVVGQGLAAPLADLFSLSLCAIGLSAESPPADSMSLGIVMESLARGSVVVGISAAGESITVANVLKYAAQRGARTLALTWSPIDMSAQAAEVAISCPANELFALPSVALLAVWIDAFVQALAEGDRDMLRSRAERIIHAQDILLSKRRR